MATEKNTTTAANTNGNGNATTAQTATQEKAPAVAQAKTTEKLDLRKFNTKDIPWNNRTADALRNSGKYANLKLLDDASDADLMALGGLGEKAVREIRTQVNRVKESGTIEGLERIVLPRKRQSMQRMTGSVNSNISENSSNRGIAHTSEDVVDWASSHEQTVRGILAGELIVTTKEAILA